MNPSPTLWLVLAASPSAPGASALYERALAHVAAGGRVRAILSFEGLAWIADPRLGELAALGEAEVSLCSRSAREQGRTAETLPAWLRWSSLISWLRDYVPNDPLWGLLP